MVRFVNRYFVRQSKKKSDKPPGCLHCIYEALPYKTLQKLRNMPYRLLEHTADLCFEVTAPGYEDLPGEALRAMTEWIGPQWSDGSVERPFRIEAPDRVALLVDLLNEALAFSQIYREAYDAITIRSSGEEFVEGSFVGRAISGARDEIKAVTWHGAMIEKQADGSWMARLLMDI
jgi:SHS2 domain-containing protein